MGLKNKSQLRDSFKQGKLLNNQKWYFQESSDPLKFANSSDLQKIKNRNRKNK